METRERRKWWVVADGTVIHSEGLSCGPDNPDYWWFPTIGMSVSEGHHAFADRASAVAKALVELRLQRALVDTQISNLENSR